MENKSLVKDENNSDIQLVTVQSNLMNLLKTKREALPKDFNQTRFLQNCIIVLQDVKELDQIEALSVARTMLRGAFLGLDFFNKECYAIPYNKNIGTKEKAVWVKELQFQTDYKGEKKIVKKYSINPIKEIYAKEVREGDSFEEFIIDGRQSINFKPKLFSNNKIIGVFAIVLFKDDSMSYEKLTVKEVNDIRNAYSKSPNSPAWIKRWVEMAKKTVLRLLCKNIEIDFESVEQQKTYNDASDMDMRKKPEKQVAISSLDTIDVKSEEVDMQKTLAELNEKERIKSD